MNIKHHKLLHYVLIILLMVAPFRGAVATYCDMGYMGGIDVSSSSTAMAHDMSAMLSPETAPSEMNEHDCCDDSSVNCSGSCDLGVSVSLILQGTSYSPVYKNSFKSVSLFSKILFREPTPPSRPPAILHS